MGQIKSGQVESRQAHSGQVIGNRSSWSRSCGTVQVGTGQAKLGKVNLSQDCSSPFKTGQVGHNLFRLKFLLDKNFIGTFYLTLASA